MDINQLKEEAKQDMANLNGECGFAKATIDGEKILVIARKWGGNKPGRDDHVRYTYVTTTDPAAPGN